MLDSHWDSLAGETGRRPGCAALTDDFLFWWLMTSSFFLFLFRRTKGTEVLTGDTVIFFFFYLLLMLLSCFSHVRLCDPIDGSPPGSPIPGILQARTLECVVISFSSARKWKVKLKSLSRVWLFLSPWTAAYQAPPSLGFSRQEYWSGLPLPSLRQTAKSWQWITKPSFEKFKA